MTRRPESPEDPPMRPIEEIVDDMRCERAVDEAEFELVMRAALDWWDSRLEVKRLRRLLDEPSDEMVEAAAAPICSPNLTEFESLPEDDRMPYMMTARAALRAAGRAALGEPPA